MSITIRPGTEQDALDLIKEGIRAADVREVRRFSGESAGLALLKSVRLSLECFAVRRNGVCVCMFGVAPWGVTGKGTPWMLAATEIESHSRKIALISRQAVAVMSHGYSYLENFADAENAVSHRWLRWLGFTVEEEDTIVNGHPFKRFYREL